MVSPPISRLQVLAICAVTACLVSCSEGKPPQSQTWKSATGAEAYERSFWKSIEEADFPSAERCLAPIYTLTTPSGIAAREDAIQYFHSLKLKRISIAELHVVPQGNDMVVSYVATVETQSAPRPTRYYMTSVWQQVKRGWIVITHTEVPAS